MGKDREKTKVSVEIEFTEGYQERFTTAIMKIFEKRIREEQNRREDDNKSA
ncbi:MAG: hypothetical protein K2M91_05700 [Lachnospiraceae bacterium]|nr:hypothetical protein [Lachnospiraceae bacterium]